MLFLRLDQALQLLDTCRTPRETLIIRYMMLNGLSNMELAEARIEHLDPVSCELFLPKRHWKRNCIADIDQETVTLQIVYSGSRKKGPLIRNNRTNGHLSRMWIWWIVKTVACHTTIPNAEKVNPLTLKRTFARLYLKTLGNTISGLQKAFSHKHLWSTAHYLRFVLDDVRQEKRRLMRRLESEKTKQSRLVS